MTGFAMIVHGLASEPGSGDAESIPSSMSEMVGEAADAHIEVLTGEQTDVMRDVGEWVGGQPAGVLDLLLIGEELGDGTLSTDDGLDNYYVPDLERLN